MQRTYQLSEIAPTHADRQIAALLAGTGRRQRFAAGELIQQQGDAGQGFWLVERGEVMACRFGSAGELTVFAVLGPGDLFGELAHFSDVSRQVDVLAESDVELVRIDPPLIDRLLETEPDFARWLLRSLTSQLRAALDRIEGDRILPAPARIARALDGLAGRSGPSIEITQQQLADFVGVSRVTVGQVLGRLEAAGAIERCYGQIVVRDRPKLLSGSI
jgi:CRP/FNR family cyclic AMP-dependent transcriptional regulator